MLTPSTTSNCIWQHQSHQLKHYHDHEWGFAVKQCSKLFEKLCLECLQAGLSWRTILAKRTAIRLAFAHFDYHIVAQYNENDVRRLCQNRDIIRNQIKIRAIIHNAAIAINIAQEHTSFSDFIWQFQPMEETQPRSAPPKEAKQMVKALKRLNWRFIGETSAYAFMQAAGLINDHDLDCPKRMVVDEYNHSRHRYSE